MSDLMRKLVESMEDADTPTKCKDCGCPMRKGSCPKCGYKEDSGMQMYGSEPSGGMAEAVLTVEDVEKICPECAESMRTRNISGVKLESVLQSGIFELTEDDDGVLIEREGEEGWPKKLKPGRFTKYCKDEGLSGPSEACAERAMESGDESIRGMASFYTGAKPASAVDEGKIPPQFLSKSKKAAKKKKKKSDEADPDAKDKSEACESAEDKKRAMEYDGGITEMVGLDAVKAWAAHPLPEGIRMTTNTVIIGNTRVAERDFASKHARVIKGGFVNESVDPRSRDIVERALRDAGYAIELIDRFVS